MEMADNPKLDLALPFKTGGLLEESNNMDTPKISVLDHVNGIQYAEDKSDNFVIDMDSFSHGSCIKDINPNSRITLQRSFSRKGLPRNSEKKIISNAFTNNTETSTAASSTRGPSSPEKVEVVAVGTTEFSNSPQVHHQITITAGNTITTGNFNATTEGKCTIRRNSFKRPPSSWVLDPKRVLFFFATLSSLGTILLIYFTLSIGKPGGDVGAHD